MTERRRLVGAASLLLVAVAAAFAGAVAGGSDQREPAPAAAPALEGLVAELVDRRHELEPGQVAWQTRWRLCWTPQDGARDYLITIVTSEGVDPTGQRTVESCYSLTIASGTAPPGGVRDDRNAQLDLVESTLSVSVAARMRDGRIGPPSPDMPVGRAYRAGG